MADVVKVVGIPRAINKLRSKEKDYAKSTERGVVKGALFLQRMSQKVVPVDTGNLRASARTDKQGSGFKTKAIVRYTANYAIFVHENLAARHKPGKTAKYLERPARQYRNEIREIILKEARKGRGR